LQDERTSDEGARAEAVRGPEGQHQADEPGVERRRQGDAGEDRRREVASDQVLRLQRIECDRRVELCGKHLRARTNKEVTASPRMSAAIPGGPNPRESLRSSRGLEQTIMGQKIERDHQRFRKIVRGKVKSNLSKYIGRGEMIGKKGNDLVSIPLPQIDIPQFRYGQKGSGGVGQGEGDVGQPLTAPKGDDSGAGDQPGGHILEVELTMEELADILGEELALPRIEPRGKKNIITTKDKYTGIRQAGPESLRHFKRTFKRALRRQIASGVYDPDRPLVVPIREDK